MPERQVEIAIHGMTCDHCVRAITQALEAVKGVSNVNVSLPEKRAVVTYDSAQTDDQDLRAAIDAEGYNAKL